jgi:hypothetical protein
MNPCAFEIGGLYQKDQASFSGCACEAVEGSNFLVSEMDVILGAFANTFRASLFGGALGTADPIAVSKGLPVVFGVLAEPNDAKAPDPKPNALDAPVGETKPTPGVVAKGLGLTCDGVSPPWRFTDEPLRLESPVTDPLVGFPGVVNESLPVLMLV